MALKNLLFTMSKVNEWLQSPSGQAAKVPGELRTAVATALSQGMETLNKMGTPKGERGAVGRPPSTFYIVDITNYEPRRVAGGQAACDLVNQHMERLGQKRRFTAGNISVSISRNGEWFHNVDSGSGTVTLSVQREIQPKKSAQ